MQSVVIKTIPHNGQRYETVGDYFTDALGVRQFRISEMQNPDYEFLVALHEFIESYLVQKRGISDAVIDDFDKAFEAERARGTFQDGDEPGDSLVAPYHEEHTFATIIEEAVAAELGVEWGSYTAAVDALHQEAK